MSPAPLVKISNVFKALIVGYLHQILLRDPLSITINTCLPVATTLRHVPPVVGGCHVGSLPNSYDALDDHPSWRTMPLPTLLTRVEKGGRSVLSNVRM